MAAAQTKSLKLYYIHTGEKADIVYKKNGRYLASGLKKINWHLRDWRRNEPTNMDPKLLDLVWEAYRQSGSKGYITVISGYRSPASNTLLRKRGRGVAKNSQHTLGKALDFYLPDVKLKKLRDIGLKLQVGGVGYYPTSGSPFVHLDVGNVRHWPRMSRNELVSVFPDGKTMHVPSDGKPLARYEQAVASYNARSKSGNIVPEGKPTTKQLNFFQRLAQNVKDDQDDDESNEAAPTPRAVTATKQAPAPAPAPASEPVVEPTPVQEPQFASLPTNIPVPTLAPRVQELTNGNEILVASQTTELQTDPNEAAADSSQENQEAVAEPVIEEPAVEESTTVLASLNIPVPSRRPELATGGLLAAIDTAAEETVESASSELALAAPTDATGTKIAVFSPQEIEDLRAAARPTTSALTSSAEPTKPEQIILASLDTQNEVIATASIPVPQKNPAATEIQKEIAPAQQTALGIEPDTKTTGKIGIPSTNPNRPTEVVVAAEDKKIEETPLILASLPVPTRNPASAQAVIKPAQTASTQSSVKTPEAKQEPALAARTISLDNLSAPQENTSAIGQWALSSETTIAMLADVQAPAYGRNIIRQVPDVILVQGFTPQLFGPGKNNFKGKAVAAKRFARLQIQ